jgi:hypothetical protein
MAFGGGEEDRGLWSVSDKMGKERRCIPFIEDISGIHANIVKCKKI